MRVNMYGFFFPVMQLCPSFFLFVFVWGFVILDDGAASGYGFPVMVVSWATSN